jgi:hypothetical protein
MLIRLFNSNKEAEASSRGSVTLEQSTLASTDMGGLAAIDPWKILFQVASESKAGLKSGLRWFCIFARSGVEIPVPRFEQVLGLVQQFGSSWEDSMLLIDALFCATWLRSLGRQELQTTVSKIHVSAYPQVLEGFKTKKINDA